MEKKETLQTFSDYRKDPNTLIIHMKSKKTGSRLLSCIERNSADSVFDYACLSFGTRSDDGKKKIPTMMKVITSGQIVHRTEVSLLEEERKIIVRMRRERYEDYPRIALIDIDAPAYVIDRVQARTPVYREAEKVYEYTFDNVEQGSYYLFIEPLFLL
ncbi:MAG TPA: hypothetical protein PK466_08750 [Thermotogota bacterium]|nr:hypothetical protein [Thermotogota bacterium]HPJ89209.1 hypothetical protein [Thermotogota bacterium]HPR96405.1 hypothetical protein [Thermotogota bacterium]